MTSGRLRHLVVIAALTLGISLLAAPAPASSTGTLVIARAELERRGLELLIERRVEDSWQPTPWLSLPFDLQTTTVVFSVPVGDYRVSWRRSTAPGYTATFGEYFQDVSTTHYPGHERAEDASVLRVEPGIAVDLTSFVAHRGGHIVGQVAREDGSALPGVAYAEVSQRRGGLWVPVSRSDITPEGSYDVGGLDSGPTIVEISGPSVTAGGHRAKGADSATFSGSATDFEAAEQFEAVATRTTTVDPIAVAPNGTLSGTARDADGRPLAGVEVEVDHLKGVVRTASDGSWDVGPVRAGSYDVTIVDPQDRVELQRRDAAVELRQDTVVDTTHPHHGPVWTEGPSFVPTDRLGMMGQRITVDPGVLKQDDAVVTSIDWYVGPEDSPPRIAMGRTYTPPMESEVDLIYAVVTAERRGVTRTATTRGVMLRHPEYFTGRPTTSTTAPVAHELLTARTGTLSPTPSTTTWQWLRDGKAIKGATGTRYRPTPSDVGRNVVAQATVQRPGYARAVVRSTSRDVTSARSSVKATLTPRGGRRVAVSARVTVAKVSAAYVDGSLDVYRSRKGSDRIGTIRVVDGRATTTLTRQPKGKRTYWVRFRPSRDGMTTSQGARASVRVR